MATVQRANVVLQVPDEADIIQKYKDKGFDVIDPSTGKVLDKAIPHEPGALRARIVELEKELAEKEAEIARLKERKAPKVEAGTTPKRSTSKKK